MTVLLPYRTLSLKTSVIITLTLFIIISVFNDQQIYSSTKTQPITYFQGDWQYTGHPEYKFVIYSAYSYDNNEVVIIGGPRPNLQKKGLEIKCQFLSANVSYSISGATVTTRAKVESLKGWPSKIAGSFIRCPLPNPEDVHSKPEFLSILLGNQSESPARLPIQYRDLNEHDKQYKFSACVLPLYGYNQVFHLIEWLEYYRMMGVEHFTFYNLTIGPAASCVMNNLEKWTNGEVSVKINPWHRYPQKRAKDIHFGKGLTPGINDCFYSHKGVSKYLVFVDMDEFLVPEIEGLDNFEKMINYLDENYDSGNNTFGEYRFRCAFYEKSRPQDNKLLDRCSEFRGNFQMFHICQQLWMMKFDKREEFRTYRSRSKFIAMPDGIRNAGNHYAYEFEKGYTRLLVPEQVGFMRHYRYFDKGNRTTEQRISNKVGMELVGRVGESLKYFKNVCNFSDSEIFT